MTTKAKPSSHTTGPVSHIAWS